MNENMKKKNLDRDILKDIFYIEEIVSSKKSVNTRKKRITVSDTMEGLTDIEIVSIIEQVKNVSSGTNIKAIKAYRSYTGANLKQAKTVISFLQRVLTYLEPN